MIVSNEMARLLCSEVDVGDTTSNWNDLGMDADVVYPNLEVVHSEMIDTSRWSHIYERVYKDLDTGKYWRTSYRVGATECQDERPYENDGEFIEFDEVVPRETIIIEYVAVRR